MRVVFALLPFPSLKKALQPSVSSHVSSEEKPLWVSKCLRAAPFETGSRQKINAGYFPEQLLPPEGLPPPFRTTKSCLPAPRLGSKLMTATRRGVEGLCLSSRRLERRRPAYLLVFNARRTAAITSTRCRVSYLASVSAAQAEPNKHPTVRAVRPLFNANQTHPRARTAQHLHRFP